MRYQQDHKEQTRKKIVSTAATLFRKDGVVATGVVGLMKGVGLTQGGFYAHFESKEALIREATTSAVMETAEGLEQVAVSAGNGASGLKAVVDAYLSDAHLRSAELGCVIAAVGAELVREPEATREAVMNAAERMILLIQSRLPETVVDAHGVARSIFGLMSGTLQLARLSVNPKDAADILAGGRRSAMALSGLAV